MTVNFLFPYDLEKQRHDEGNNVDHEYGKSDMSENIFEFHEFRNEPKKSERTVFITEFIGTFDQETAAGGVIFIILFLPNGRKMWCIRSIMTHVTTILCWAISVMLRNLFLCLSRSGRL